MSVSSNSYPEFPKPLSLAVPQLHLLLFTDERSAHRGEIKRVQDQLARLRRDTDFILEVINIKDQPQLVELYRLVATPSLVKVFPEPMQVFAGSNILPDLDRWWGQWLHSLVELTELDGMGGDRPTTAYEMLLSKSRVEHSQEVMQLADEVFQLQREKEELLKQIEFKDQMLAMLAHDLRNPLTGVSIALETLEIIAKRPENENTQSLKAQLHQQARNQLLIMNRMITELLDTSRQITTRLDIRPRQMSLSSLCREILYELGDRFRRKSLQIVIDMPLDLPDVYGDRELIRQVVVNLLDNAIKYSPEGGNVRLVGLHRTSQQVQFSVIDTGHGIPEDEREKIFEGHFRLQRDHQEEGYGLGLAVCRRIVQAHHGKIWVDSVLGQGSEFHIILPVYAGR